MSTLEKPPVIIGAGIAGLLTALHLAPSPVVLITSGELQSGSAGCSSALAQGGIAAAIGDEDSPAQHTADTVAAGAYLSDQQVANNVAHAAPDVIATLQRYGVEFDTGADNQLRLALEGGHLRRRVVHAADATGAEIMRVLENCVAKSDHVTVYENTSAQRLLTNQPAITDVGATLNQHITGVDIGDEVIETNRVVLATGGLGALFAHTTNPRHARHCGMALAACVGARLRDLEFIQFHPTALDVKSGSLPLISEAVRGEGARLVDENNCPLPVDPLATRDVVARAVWQAEQEGKSVFLDTSALRDVFDERFPGIAEKCREAGIDPSNENIPVRTAAHYTMGGVVVDYRGRTSISGLWAAGEVAHTGLHGANRLASNSLLEGAAYAQWVATDLAAWHGHKPHEQFCFRRDGHTSRQIQDSYTGDGKPGTEGDELGQIDVSLIISAALGIERDAQTLNDSIQRLLPHVGHNDNSLMALLMCICALQRPASVGAHHRIDTGAPEPREKSDVAPERPAINATALPERNAS